MILKVTNVVYVKDYILALTFSNGEVRNFDFATVYNEIGFAPEFLYDNAMTA